MLTNGRSSPPRGGMEICNHVSAFERSHEDIGLGVKYLGGKVPFRGSSVIPFINPKNKKKTGMVYNGHNHQYEAIAREDIAEGEYIGEYAGRVKYTSDSTATSMYVAVRAIKIHFDKPHLAILTCYFHQNLFFADGLPEILYKTPLCIDSQHEGNETRFINSISPTSPPYITQNASMSTVWCRGQVPTPALLFPKHSQYAIRTQAARNALGDQRHPCWPPSRFKLQRVCRFILRGRAQANRSRPRGHRTGKSKRRDKA